jgi:hypothetical protein
MTFKKKTKPTDAPSNAAVLQDEEELEPTLVSSRGPAIVDSVVVTVETRKLSAKNVDFDSLVNNHRSSTLRQIYAMKINSMPKDQAFAESIKMLGN